MDKDDVIKLAQEMDEEWSERVNRKVAKAAVALDALTVAFAEASKIIVELSAVLEELEWPEIDLEDEEEL